MMKLPSQQSFPPSHEAICNQLNHMLASPDLNASPQQTALLKYVVNQTLAGNADRIKGYTVATEVFGRCSDFDQSIDPIVSIQAARLRRAIAQYYETAGKNDPICIDIPKGTYVPTFDEQLPGHEHIATEPAEPVGVMQTWPTVLILPLANLSTDSEDNYLAIGLTAELAHALGHYREIRILEAPHGDQKFASPQMDFDFIIDGHVRRDPAGIQVAIRLCDARKGLRVWSDKYQGDLEAARMISFQEDVAAEVAVRVAGGNALITRHLSGLCKNKEVPDLTTYEAMLRYWEYNTLRTRKSYVRAHQALEHAVAHEPGCGQAWSMLARLYADNYGLEIVDLPTPLEKAAAYAEKGVSLDPTNRCTRMILSYVRFMENNLPEARHEAEAAYQLCPNSLMALDNIGWLTALAGEWERGVKWITRAMRLNPYYRIWARYAVFLNRFREADFEKAYRESLHFMMPESHWDHLLKASVCGHLGKIEEGQACVRALLALKPNFAKRGRILIERYVKFEDIADCIIDGLDKLGMKIAA